MLVLGFEDENITQESEITKQIQKYELGGVILFDRFYNEREKVKNIRSPKQLQALTKQLQAFSKKRLFICIDQEGGRVARLKPSYGFEEIPSAEKISHMPVPHAKSIYENMAHMLRQNGINCDFGPVVDLALNPKNSVIVGLERSYGSSSQEVSNYAKIFVKALESQNIQPVLKHFPGHGSSLGDSHLGFVDVTKTWSQKELEPYQELIDSGDASMIMTAHVFNANLDAKYPATLSYNVNTKLLRQKMGYKGLIVSDDLQMAAIAEHYTLEETVRLAINSGIDILLFGNQLRRNDAKEIIDTIYKEIQNGKISLSNIVESNKRIALLHTKRRIIQKPIDFPQERIQMSKEYIRTHYGLDVKDITIKPKMIVLHWTAVMDLNSSFMRLKPQMLFSDRKDIADAGALNVSAHFLVARDGTIYQLMPDNLMARHVIGLNYSSIGVENVGGKDNIKEDLTPAQVEANIALVRYLKTKYPSIDYLIGHHEYLKMQTNPLWLEKDKNYRTLKNDPGNNFMQAVRKDLTDLQFKEL